MLKKHYPLFVGVFTVANNLWKVQFSHNRAISIYYIGLIILSVVNIVGLT